MFAITTDTGGDLPLEMLREHGVGLMSLHYTVEGQTYDAYHPMPDRDFYERMRGGAMPTTARSTRTRQGRSWSRRWPPTTRCCTLRSRPD